jgi:hypothetical protein
MNHRIQGQIEMLPTYQQNCIKNSQISDFLNIYMATKNPKIHFFLKSQALCK